MSTRDGSRPAQRRKERYFTHRETNERDMLDIAGSINIALLLVSSTLLLVSSVLLLVSSLRG